MMTRDGTNLGDNFFIDLWIPLHLIKRLQHIIPSSPMILLQIHLGDMICEA